MMWRRAENYDTQFLLSSTKGSNAKDETGKQTRAELQ